MPTKIEVTASDLIKILQSTIDEHGDVFVETASGREAFSVAHVFQTGGKFDASKGETPPVVAVTIK